MRRLLEQNPRLLYVMQGALVSAGVDTAGLVVLGADRGYGEIMLLYPNHRWEAAFLHGPLISVMQGQRGDEVRGDHIPVLVPYAKTPVPLAHAVALPVMDGIILWADRKHTQFEEGPLDMLKAAADLCRDHITTALELDLAQKRLQVSSTTVETMTSLSNAKKIHEMAVEMVKFVKRVGPVKAAFFGLVDKQDPHSAVIMAADGKGASRYLGKRFGLHDSLVGLALHTGTEIPNTGRFRKGMNRVFGHALPNPVSSEEGLIVIPALTNRRPVGVLVAIGNDFSDSYIRFYMRNAVQVMANRVTTLEELSAVEEKSMFDPLTGLYTRTAMTVRMVEVLAAARRYGRPMSVMMLDIDHFKRVNDTYGHQVGDQVLLYTSQQILHGMRESDMAARYGGEEFLVILPETKKEEAAVIAERIRANLDGAPVPVGTHALHITISIGVTCCKTGDCTPEELIRDADRNLYRAKETGRNRVVI